MIRKASKENVRLRIANCGESNSGKTFSALILAQEIASSMGKVVIIDTENRADLYEEHFQGYGVIDIAPPFDPEKAIEALDACAKAGAEFVIFDSASDIWERTKQLHDEMPGGAKMSFYNWAKITPRWDAFKAKINTAPFHIVTCWRMKEKLVAKDGQMVSEGLKVVARGGAKGIKFDYQIAFVLNDKHMAIVGKDNLHLFSDWEAPAVIDQSVALKIKNWIMGK